MKKTFRELARQRKEVDQEYKMFIVHVRGTIKKSKLEADFRQKQQLCREVARVLHKLEDALGNYASDVDDVIKVVKG